MNSNNKISKLASLLVVILLVLGNIGRAMGSNSITYPALHRPTDPYGCKIQAYGGCIRNNAAAIGVNNRRGCQNLCDKKIIEL